MVRLTENNREVFSNSTTLATTREFREFTVVEMRYKITEIVSLCVILIHRQVNIRFISAFLVLYRIGNSPF